MSKALVVVESPAKAKTIGKYLGRNYVVKASVGHIKDLPKSKLGVDVENDFTPQYGVIPAKVKVVKELRAAAKGIDDIYLAADPDREGEAICQHLYEELAGKSKNIYRVLFHEITKNAILEAFKNPGRINQNKVDAQLARRILDRLVGYKISPLLWQKVRRGLSAGRVQTVALRLIVDREREIRAFVSEEYWTLDAHCRGASPAFRPGPGSWMGRRAVADRESSDRIVGELADTASSSAGSTAGKEEIPRPPSSPATAAGCGPQARFFGQADHGGSPKAVRGSRSDEGAVGLITYMRTDSTRVAESALEEVRGLIRKNYGEDYLPPRPIHYKSKKTAQEAHEAIRPTSVARTPESMKGMLEPDLWKLYNLIWNRFVASQMNPALFDQTDIDIEAGRVEFRATGSISKFRGFLAVYQESRPEDDPEDAREEAELVLPETRVGERLQLQKLLPVQHFTQPPARYNEAGLVKALESKGIGRPSTYASILSTIQDREYVDKNEGRFHPSEIGEVVLDLLVGSFQELFDYEYTARMEDQLDLIESGHESWKETIAEFYRRFSDRLATAAVEMRDIKTEAVQTDEVCDKCGSMMVIKWGRFGRFLACSAYPDCKNTRQIAATGSEGGGEAPRPEEIECEKCGKPMVLKRGRFGEFMACSGYPECRNTKKIVKSADQVTVKQDVLLDETCPVCGHRLALKHGRFGEYTACSDYPNCKYIKLKSTGVPCGREGCTGEIVERKSRRGKTFYGCSLYPDCDFVLWNKPLDDPCPLCGAPFTLTKTTKRTGTIRFCNSEGCAFKESLD